MRCYCSLLLIFFQLFSLHVYAVAHFFFSCKLLVRSLFGFGACHLWSRRLFFFLFIQCNEPYFGFTYENGKTSLFDYWTTVIVLCFSAAFLVDGMTILNMQSSFRPRRTQLAADGTWVFGHFVSHEICARSSLSFHSPVFLGFAFVVCCASLFTSHNFTASWNSIWRRIFDTITTKVTKQKMNGKRKWIFFFFFKILCYAIFSSECVVVVFCVLGILLRSTRVVVCTHAISAALRDEGQANVSLILHSEKSIRSHELFQVNLVGALPFSFAARVFTSFIFLFILSDCNCVRWMCVLMFFFVLLLCCWSITKNHC